MKKSVLLLCGMFLLLCGSALAQEDFPKAEVFGGFSIASTDLGAGNLIDRQTFYGFQANAAFNFHKNVGIVADFGGHYKGVGGGTLHAYEYLFGPRASLRSEKATVFGHALFGGATIGDGGLSQNGFAMGFGGGIDVNAGKRFAIRVIQFDWIPARFEGDWINDNVRFGFGIVIK